MEIRGERKIEWENITVVAQDEDLYLFGGLQSSLSLGRLSRMLQFLPYRTLILGVISGLQSSSYLIWIWLYGSNQFIAQKMMLLLNCLWPLSNIQSVIDKSLFFLCQFNIAANPDSHSGCWSSGYSAFGCAIRDWGGQVLLSATKQIQATWAGTLHWPKFMLLNMGWSLWMCNGIISHLYWLESWSLSWFMCWGCDVYQYRIWVLVFWICWTSSKHFSSFWLNCQLPFGIVDYVWLGNAPYLCPLLAMLNIQHALSIS